MIGSPTRARQLCVALALVASRAAVIAIATVIVETHLQNISEEVDHDSLGLFQQRASWGTRAQRLNPTWATNAFLNKMIRLYPNNSWTNAPIGEVCQAVQVSAYPDRYQVQASDAQIIVNTLWNVSGPEPVPVPVEDPNVVQQSGDFHGDGRDASLVVARLLRMRGSGILSGRSRVILMGMVGRIWR